MTNVYLYTWKETTKKIQTMQEHCMHYIRRGKAIKMDNVLQRLQQAATKR
jgi:hypothetical protein